MNNIIMGRILPFLITFAAFTGGSVSASQIQASSSQIQSSSASSDSDHGGRSLKDQEDAKVLIKEGDALYRMSARLLEKNDKQQAYAYLITSGEKYAAAVILGNWEALEKLVEVADTLLKKLFFKEAREFYMDAARFGHEGAQKQLAFLIDNATSFEIQLPYQNTEHVLVFTKPSDCEDYMGDVRHQAQEKKQDEANRSQKEGNNKS